MGKSTSNDPQSAGPKEVVPPLSKQAKVAIAISFLNSLAFMSVNPLLAPLARELSFAEWQLGVVISLSATIITLTSRTWGRISQTTGAKPILTYASANACIALFCFAAIVQAASSFTIEPHLLFVMFAFTRGLWLGTGIAAINPTVQTHVALHTPTQAMRIKGMATLGAAQGMSMIAGASVAGVLGGLSIVLVMWIIPLANLSALLLAWFGLERKDKKENATTSEDATSDDTIPTNQSELNAAETVYPSTGAAATVGTFSRVQEPNGKAPLGARIKALLKSDDVKKISPFDARIRPYISIIFIIYSAFGFVQILLGFVIQDRYNVTPEHTAAYTGAMMIGAGAAMLISQGLLVPRLGWQPGSYIKLGTILAFCGMVLMSIPGPFVQLAAATATIGLGIGFVLPGANAGASLAVATDEQGATAGTVNATIALTWMYTPIMATSLYAVKPSLPSHIGVCLTAAAVIIVFVSKQFKRNATV